MKKFGVICIVFFVALSVFAQSDFWISGGFQYGSYWEKTEKLHEKNREWLGSPGFVLNTYIFFNKKPIGIGIQNSFLFPQNSFNVINGVRTKDVVKEYDTRFFFQFAIGPGFRYPISPKLTLYSSAGFNMSIVYAALNRIIMDPITYTDTYIWIDSVGLNLGVMGTIGIKYNITNNLYFDCGTKLGFDFLQYTNVRSSIPIANISGWSTKYIGFNLLPHLGIGYTIPF